MIWGFVEASLDWSLGSAVVKILQYILHKGFTECSGHSASLHFSGSWNLSIWAFSNLQNLSTALNPLVAIIPCFVRSYTVMHILAFKYSINILYAYIICIYVKYYFILYIITFNVFTTTSFFALYSSTFISRPEFDLCFIQRNFFSLLICISLHHNL